MTKYEIEQMATYLFEALSIICNKFYSCDSCPFCNAPCYNKDKFIDWVIKEMEE